MEFDRPGKRSPENLIVPFKKLRRLQQRKCHLKIRWNVLRLCYIGHLCEIGEVYFRLLGTSGFHVKAKNERFRTTGSRRRHSLKYEKFTSSFDRLRQKIAPESVTHVWHNYFPRSINQINPIPTLTCHMGFYVPVGKRPICSMKLKKKKTQSEREMQKYRYACGDPHFATTETRHQSIRCRIFIEIVQHPC